MIELKISNYHYTFKRSCSGASSSALRLAMIAAELAGFKVDLDVL